MKTYTVNIMGAEWEVTYVTEALMHEGKEVSGLCDPDRRTIRINTVDASEDLMNRSLMHELMHAHLFMSGVCELVENNEVLCVMAENFTNIFQLRKGALMPCKKGKKKPGKK
jgi:Zn-dependent peptidase ImmA (M78 family)